MRFQKADKSEVKQNQEEEKPISAADVLKILQEQGASRSQEDQARLLEAVALLAKNITNPPPSDEQLAIRRKILEERVQQAQEHDAQKAYKRKHCAPPADPSHPHRRPQDHGQFSGKSVVAWHFTTLTEKGPAGSRDGSQVAFGFCPWCASEWGPNDPDYAEALSWGIPSAYGSYPMNRSNGQWSS